MILKLNNDMIMNLMDIPFRKTNSGPNNLSQVGKKGDPGHNQIQVWINQLDRTEVLEPENRIKVLNIFTQVMLWCGSIKGQGPETIILCYPYHSGVTPGEKQM